MSRLAKEDVDGFAVTREVLVAELRVPVAKLRVKDNEPAFRLAEVTDVARHLRVCLLRRLAIVVQQFDLPPRQSTSSKNTTSGLGAQTSAIRESTTWTPEETTPSDDIEPIGQKLSAKSRNMGVLCAPIRNRAHIFGTPSNAAGNSCTASSEQ